MSPPEVVSREEWLAARKELLDMEKELTRARDGLNADRRRLPMVRVDKPYTFEGPNGKVGLLGLFEDRAQLVMHHFMWTYRNEEELASTKFPWSESMRGDYPGISAFLRVGDEVFHTYSTFARGIDLAGSPGYYLDLTALGRQEEWEEPKGRSLPLGLQAGGPEIRRPDEYDA